MRTERIQCALEAVVTVDALGIIPGMMTKVLLLLCGIISLVVSADQPRVIFSNDFKDWYPDIIDPSKGALTGLPLEAPVTVTSPHQVWAATVTRTEGTKVPYDQSLGRIEVTSDGQPMTVIRTHGFRTITVTWINDRLLHVNLGLGRIAEVEAIYDMQGHQWLYRDSISYPP